MQGGLRNLRLGGVGPAIGGTARGEGSLAPLQLESRLP